MGNVVKKVSKQEIKRKYTLGGMLGKGNFATVYHAKRKSDNKEFAVKVISKKNLKESELKVVHLEVEIMHKVDHPNCVRLYEIFETDKKLYMIMELLTGGELFDRIVAKGNYSEEEAAEVMRQCCKALNYLHDIGVVHRDLKPENLIYATEDDDSLLKITDFGLAKFRLPQEEMLFSTQCGTPGYVAPEVLYGRQYTSKVDMWSLGVILYILLCGYPPFYADSNAQLYKQIKRSDYSFPAEYWGEVSDLAIDLVKKLLCADEEKRLSAEQVLQHPWLAHGNASRKELGATLEQLERTQARMRLRKGIQTILAVNKFRHMVKQFANNRDVE